MMYCGNWSSYEDMQWDTAYGERLPPPDAIVYASYESPDYEGWATIIYLTPDGELMENNDSHCSCYGLESWNPEVTTVKFLLTRDHNKYQGIPGITEALKARNLI